MLINSLAIIGVGLIGGSLARALKRKNACKYICGYDRERKNLEQALDLGVIDSYSMDITKIVKDADVVVLATPIKTTSAILREIKDDLAADTILTDVGSVKGSIIAAVRNEPVINFANFVPGHPIAGTEKSGVAASFAELFEDHIVILTPHEETNVHAISAITQMWETAGANVINMSAEHHDKVLAATSHLPHVLAYALVDCLAGMQEREEIFRFAAGGFADFTRIASSSPEMWHDVCLSNSESILAVLHNFDHNLGELRQAIETGNSEALMEIFNRAKKARDEFISKRG